MKNISIKKSIELSPDSKVLLHIGLNKIHIKGYKLHRISVNPDEEIYASHLWTKSCGIQYDKINNSSYVIKPRLKKFHVLIILMVLVLCFLLFFITNSRWSFLPLVPLLAYILAYLTILKDRYLIIEEEAENNITKS